MSEGQKAWTRSAVSCRACHDEFRSRNLFNQHWCRVRDGHERDTQVSLHLTPDDVFSQGSQPAMLQSRRQERNLHREAERFHRQVLRTKANNRAKRAKAHGWTPLNDLRHLGDVQI